jgi:hypothetical protein
MACQEGKHENRDVLSSPFVSECYGLAVRANQLLKANVEALLKDRHVSRKELAIWCYRSESWISKIFTNVNREIPLKYLDRIADFFGLATYQLFQPGIASSTERRHSERRTSPERRVSHKFRAMESLRHAVESMQRDSDDERAPLPTTSETARMSRTLQRIQTDIADLAATLSDRRPARAAKSAPGTHAESAAAGTRPRGHRRRRTGTSE